MSYYHLKLGDRIYVLPDLFPRRKWSNQKYRRLTDHCDTAACEYSDSWNCFLVLHSYFWYFCIYPCQMIIKRSTRHWRSVNSAVGTIAMHCSSLDLNTDYMISISQILECSSGSSWCKVLSANCSSQPSMVHRLSSSIFPFCSFVCSSVPLW